MKVVNLFYKKPKIKHLLHVIYVKNMHMIIYAIKITHNHIKFTIICDAFKVPLSTSCSTSQVVYSFEVFLLPELGSSSEE